MKYNEKTTNVPDIRTNIRYSRTSEYIMYLKVIYLADEAEITLFYVSFISNSVLILIVSNTIKYAFSNRLQASVALDCPVYSGKLN